MGSQLHVLRPLRGEAVNTYDTVRTAREKRVVYLTGMIEGKIAAIKQLTAEVDVHTKERDRHVEDLGWDPTGGVLRIKGGQE